MRTTLAFAVAVCLVLWSAAGRAGDDSPSASLKLTAKSVAVGVGYSWGKGELVYQGQTYPVEVSGLVAIAVGLNSIEADGGVYHLTKLEDFDGNYVAVRGGSGIGEGGASAVMRNQHGVEVRLVAKNSGVTLTLGTSGVSLKAAPPASQ
ncbi:MAG TPA: hypothetical protein VMR31_09575 [Myxococcota bacterium]|nr:hypothetical protein [Myxococcota bacterium]